MRLVGVHDHVTLAIVAMGTFQPHRLVPRMRPADRVRVNGEGQVLVHAALPPPHAARIGVVRIAAVNQGT